MTKKTASSAAPAVSLDLVERLGADVSRRLEGLASFVDRLGQEPLGPDGQACLRAIDETLSDVRELLARANDLNAARVGALSIEPRPQALRLLMDDLETRWAVEAAAVGATLLVSYDGEPDAAVMADPRRIGQIFDALIGRALGDAGRGAVEASLKARETAEGMVIEGRVRDNGDWSPDQAAGVFRAGVDNADMNLSVGLGMALARRLAQAMGGKASAEANVGPGVTITFELTLPVALIAEPAEAEPIAGAHRVAHVLIVDDNATNRMVVEALCETFDCTSEQVEDGVEAVEAARSGRFDIILMDIKMPRMDGVEATRTIRELPGKAGVTPIIALTAKAAPADIQSYLSAGMQNLVEKPIAPERLLEAMNTALAAAEGVANDRAVA
ncbi:response regulator [Caulobacter segnis]|uniref:response regulator n=1 Tax=Caulobacter segnis TaxID=88688 RepID=UPI00240F0455|nr:response regulator [Caulobacter segnis]MDG2523391.1 response regulator [Caulobacter segnis]